MKLPTSDELNVLRKGLRKRKVPVIFNGMWCSEPGIGGMTLKTAGSDLQVEWVSFDDGVRSPMKSAAWKALCSNPELEMQRLEVGMVVSAVFQAQAQKVMNSIGHPIEAFRAAKPYLDAANQWKHWGTVKAGHMIGL